MPLSPEPKAEGGVKQTILDAIGNFVAEHGCAPTEREIADAVKLSKTAVHYHIGKLKHAGKLRKIDAGGRSLALVESGAQVAS
jgi:SOS-response transcriptional repressor LexA